MIQVNKRNRMLTTRDVARILNVHINTVRRWTDRGILDTYRLGPRGDRRFDAEEVTRFIVDNHRATTPV